jgi:hypothetical protein
VLIAWPQHRADVEAHPAHGGALVCKNIACEDYGRVIRVDPADAGPDAAGGNLEAAH